MLNSGKAKLGILDIARRHDDENFSESLNTSLEMVKLADDLGYSRYWFTEHHNQYHTASLAPEILIAAATQLTSRIRIGAAGFLLANVKPYKLAELATMLSALSNGRLDIGIGKGRGGLQDIEALLSIDSDVDFETKAKQFHTFVSSGTNMDSKVRRSLLCENIGIHAEDEIWLLGTNEHAARVSGRIGAAFCFGHFINPQGLKNAFQIYEDEFLRGVGVEPRRAAAFNVFVERNAASARKYIYGFEADPNEPSDYDAIAKSIGEEKLRQILRDKQNCIVGDAPYVIAKIEEITRGFDLESVILHFDGRHKERRIESLRYFINSYKSMWRGNIMQEAAE